MEKPDNQKCAEVLREMINPVESIVNLLYLIKHDPEDTAVIHYVEMANRQTRRLIDQIERGPHS